MRKVMVVGAMVMIVLSLAITGTIFAQGGGGPGRGGRGDAGAWLGVRFEETDEGVVVSEVVDGDAAAEAGLLAGDVIVSVDDEAVDSGETLAELVRAHEPGDTISIIVTRDGSDVTLEIELGTMAGRGPDNISADTDPLIAAERVLRVDLEAVDEGYQVTDEGRKRPDDTLAVDDIITAVNGTPVAEVDWPTLVTDLTGQDAAALTLTVLRDGEEIEVTVESFGGPQGREQFGGMGGPGQHGGSPQDGSQDANPVVPDDSSSDSFSA